MFRSSTTEFVVLLQAFNRLLPNTQNTMPNEYIYIYIIYIIIIYIYIYVCVQGRALACALDFSLAFALGFSHACAVDFCFGLRHEVIQIILVRMWKDDNIPPHPTYTTPCQMRMLMNMSANHCDWLNVIILCACHWSSPFWCACEYPTPPHPRCACWWIWVWFRRGLATC